MKQRFANLERTDENIADQYPDIFDGLQKDAIQNAKDARITKKFNNWRIVFKYKPDYNALIIEDFGTTGMDGGRWEKYQGLWHTDKIEDFSFSGSRGQGKFLFHYFSKEKQVLTETIDEKGNYKFSYGTTQEYDDTNKLSDFFPEEPKLNHQGSKIWILNIKDEFKKELLSVEKFYNLIVASWWEVIQNYNAQIIINFDGLERVVNMPTIFSNKSKKEKNYQNEKIKELGEVRNLVIRYLNEEVDPIFQGIAIQRAGMTVLRISVRSDENIKKRIYGYCNFDEQLESELKKCELPNHMGFTTKRAWAHVREFVEHKLESFILELGPKKEIINADQKTLDEAVKLINKLVYEYAPELSEGESAPGGVTKPSDKLASQQIKPKNPIRINRFAPNERKIEFGESLITDCEIVNETMNKEALILVISIYHEGTKDIKYAEVFNFELAASNIKTINVPLVDFDKITDKSGKYIGEAVLKSSKNELDSKRFIFYLHEDPPKGKAFITKFELAIGKNLFFEKWRNLPINDKGVVRVIWDHPEFIRLREQAKSKKSEGKEIMLYCTKCGADEAMRRLLEKRYNENKLTSDELKEVRRIHNELIYGSHISIF